MPNKCCIPGCRTNYTSAGCDGRRSVFQFPSNPARRSLWVENIKRKNFTPTPSSVVCVDHFSKNSFITEDRKVKEDGSVTIVPRRKMCLKKDAIPTIFPTTEERCNNVEDSTSLSSPLLEPDNVLLKTNENNQNFVHNTNTLSNICEGNQGIKHSLSGSSDDNISSFSHFCDIFPSRINDDDWSYLKKDNMVIFLHLTSFINPRVLCSFSVSADLSVNVYHEHARLNPEKFSWLLGDYNECDKWTKFDGLRSHLLTYPDSNSVQSKVNSCYNKMKEILEEERRNSSSSSLISNVKEEYHEQPSSPKKESFTKHEHLEMIIVKEEPGEQLPET